MNADEDYMSDAFILSTGNDTCPGLIQSRSRKREIKVEKGKEHNNSRNKELTKSVKVLEAERRAAGLDEAIGPDNKGFAMLTKMGFQPGNSLGVPGNSGLVNPIEINLKNNRAGLGRYKQTKDVQLLRKNRNSEKDEISVGEYRESLSAKFARTDIQRDLRKCANACYSLDMENGVKLPKIRWFWPEHCHPVKLESDTESESEETDSENMEFTEKVKVLTTYLRETYFFCCWCGHTYHSLEELLKLCPGSSRDDH